MRPAAALRTKARPSPWQTALSPALLVVTFGSHPGNARREARARVALAVQPPAELACGNVAYGPESNAVCIVRTVDVFETPALRTTTVTTFSDRVAESFRDETRRMNVSTLYVL